MVEEVLYPAMEDYQLDIMIGEGPAARSIKLDLPPFTLVGATTRAGLLTSPLRDRFGIVQRLEFYEVGDLTRIVTRSAGILGEPIDPGGAREIAKRSRGTPRIANRLLRRVRDYAQVRADGRDHARRSPLRRSTCSKSTPLGFDTLDRQLLTTIIEKFEGGPVGIESLAAAIGEERGTLEDVIEPFLIQQGYLMRTARGRIATRHAYLHFGLRHAGTSGGRAMPLFEEGETAEPRPEPDPPRFVTAGARVLGRTPMAAAWSTTPTTCATWSARAPNGCARSAIRPGARWPRTRHPVHGA